jgi:hypothetical protein
MIKNIKNNNIITSRELPTHASIYKIIYYLLLILVTFKTTLYLNNNIYIQ